MTHLRRRLIVWYWRHWLGRRGWFSYMGLVRNRHHLVYTNRHGWGYGWLPGWALSAIPGVWNPLACRVWGHSPCPDYQPAHGIAAYGEMCYQCGKTLSTAPRWRLHQLEPDERGRRFGYFLPVEE